MIYRPTLTSMLRFLRTELDIPQNELRLALRQSEASLTTLPIILWQYGLLTLEQLDQVFDWLEHLI